MALIVEDGTGLVNAESFISVADATKYHSDRGNAAWAALATDTLREQALRRATDYMQQVYRLRWRGYRKTLAQAIEWPRLAVRRADFDVFPAYVANDIVPVEVANACAEFALRAASAALAPDLTRAKSGVVIGPLRVDYDPASPEATRYRAIDGILLPYLCDTGASVRLVRT